MIHNLKYILNSLSGSNSSSHQKAWMTRHARSMQEITSILGSDIGIAGLLRRLDDNYKIQSQHKQSPVFILSSGWRSGSTLLQRLLMSSGDLLLWGEPYSDARPIQYMARSLFSIRDGWPRPDFFLASKDIENLSDEWIANLYPDINDLYHAHVSFILRFLELPAINKGFNLWGLKDVRLSIDHAYYLQWLFPNAKFIFLVRNPVNAWKSYKGNDWYLEWPHVRIDTVEKFSYMWTVLASGFVNNHRNFNSYLLRYEDLIRTPDKIIPELETFTDLSINRDVLNNRIKGPPGKLLANSSVSQRESRKIKRLCSDATGHFGY